MCGLITDLNIICVVCGNSRTKGPDGTFHRSPHSYVHQVQDNVQYEKTMPFKCLTTSCGFFQELARSIDSSTQEPPFYARTHLPTKVSAAQPQRPPPTF